MDNEPTTAIIKEAERITEDALYSAKGHFEAARDWERWHYWIGIPAAILAAASGVSALKDSPILAAILAFLVAVLTALTTFLNPRERANQQQAAGNAYKSLQNDARIFAEVECAAPASTSLRETLSALNSRRNELNEKSPLIPRSAFERGRKGILAGEATYVADRKTESAAQRRDKC